MTEFAVLGSSGFVGSAVAHELHKHGRVRRIRAPRLPSMSEEDALTFAADHPNAVEHLARELAGVDVVVNAAGNPDASSRNVGDLVAANGALPGLIAAAADEASCRRFVHISSAVVQGASPVLDASEAHRGFSAYSDSKVLGERTAKGGRNLQTVIYRPPSVHSPSRRVSRQTAMLALSPLASVAGNGASPTPQALIDNVASAVTHLAVTTSTPPSIVTHPWEGLTTGELMRILGGKEPWHLPLGLARAGVLFLTRSGRLVRPIAANARRVELMWFGQAQAPSWLTEDGWRAPFGREGWTRLANEVRDAGRRTE